MKRAGGSGLRGVAVTLVCAAAIGLAACGGDDSTDGISDQDASAAKEIVALGQTVQEGLETRDAATVCSSFSPDGVKKRFGSQKNCVNYLNKVFNAKGAAPDYSFGTITVDGNTATAKTSEGSNMSFVQVNGKWYIDLGPSAKVATSTSDPSKSQ